MATIGEIQSLPNLGPDKRASVYFSIGKEIGVAKPPTRKPRNPPRALNRAAFKNTIAALLIDRLHGLRGNDIGPGTGLKFTGKKIESVVGDLEDIVLTPHSRKKSAKVASSRARDASVKDLAIRHCAVGLVESDAIARVIAAWAFWRLTGIEWLSVGVLKNALESQNEEEMLLAAYCLVHIDEKYVRHLQGSASDDVDSSKPKKKRSSMTIIVHGTYAKNFSWYKPGGNFHDYIKQSVFPDVYSGRDYYYWSGRYSLSERRLDQIWTAAAKKLVKWCANHPADELRIIAHSHGNNVVNIASQMGLPSCVLIQLAPPVRDWCLPDMNQVTSRRLFNIHSTIDLVVWLDGGHQTYDGTSVARYQTKKIIAWFGHSITHEPRAWRRKNIPALVRQVCP